MPKSLEAIEAYRRSPYAEEALSAAPPWLKLLASAEETVVNLERIASIRELTQSNPVLDYVERSLRLLDALPVSYWIKELVEEALAWCETAKGGSRRDRLGWQAQGINFRVHNIGSAQLYARQEAAAGAASERTQLVHALVETHGLVGQELRGEVPPEDHDPLARALERSLDSAEERERMLTALNYCIIAAVSPALWTEVEPEVAAIVRRIAAGNAAGTQLPIRERLRRLRTQSIRRGEDFEGELAALDAEHSLLAALTPLESKTFWYVEAALKDFSLAQFLKIFAIVACDDTLPEVKHISFENVMNAMYYDYKGSKKINVYKKRIIEKYLGELDWERISSGTDALGNPHLRHRLICKSQLPDTLFFDFEFSPAAERLIDFCVEAEKSSLYEKAVLLLFDLFELRRDAYDRFHNEETYLADMNSTADYKKVILDFVVGQKVLDIGPGGGVLLDLLEEKLPHVKAVGIDISANVIEALTRKKHAEARGWEVLQGDALALKDYVEAGSVDTVIFSSILHELYSYIPYNGARFNPDTVAAALRSAFDVLSDGGRIIIRDGIMTEPDERRVIRFLHPDGLAWLARYSRDFAGRKIVYEQLSQNEVSLPVNDAMEFLYTYTWGEEAYVHEVQEQFGYFTPSGYERFIRDTLGEKAEIVVMRHYLQEGYTEALADKVALFDEQGRPVPLPDSTCFIVIARRG
ncbi:class I SAM-dependent methyltransferase [Cohnella hashimotonis]|uniref:Class I SAM-dependent methyltransferase n=1 Tax=Cohnella hashimotonis TaxID=2826895 RepID=A0ABT6TCJ9_9BACL|nr:class I SAM-dependent methyltransferase [Cohnella hashimotonis]MDI4644311.1 class I SAM-dependent methyltransferase [Cohnella hashimotonis]